MTDTIKEQERRGLTLHVALTVFSVAAIIGLGLGTWLGWTWGEPRVVDSTACDTLSYRLVTNNQSTAGIIIRDCEGYTGDLQPYLNMLASQDLEVAP